MGGYWRFSDMVDFCYLINPYFPSEKLIHEMQASFKYLLIQYPSGTEVQSLLAEKNFGICRDCIVVGNGVAELIHILMTCLEGDIGIVCPTFEEYPNRYVMGKIVRFIPRTEDYSYTAYDVMHFFEEKSVSNLIIINPDNPSGNYICKKEIVDLIEWAKGKKIRLIIDESFIDFTNEENNSLLYCEALELY